MIRAMQLRNLAKETQRNYLQSVKGLAQYYQQSPNELNKEMIEDYLLYLKNDKGNTTGSVGVVVTALKFFYNQVADEPVSFDFSVRRINRKLPSVLTQDEIFKLINAPKKQTPIDFNDNLFSRASGL